MTFYYLLNPKQFIDPGWSGPPSGDAYKKYEQTISKIEARAKEAEKYTPELKTKIGDLSQTSKKILEISENLSLISPEDAKLIQLQMERDRIEKFRAQVLYKIEQMWEEEDVLMLLLLLD
jgi:uncharacterized protein (DUF342 family)